MQKSNLTLFFRQLSKSDRRSLRKYVRSPWANQREDVIALFDYLNKYVDGSPKNLERTVVFATVFPHEPTFSMPLLRYAQSFLAQVIKDFLAVDSLKQDALLYETTLLNALRTKGHSSFIDQQINKAEETFTQEGIRSESQFSILRDIKNNKLQQSIKNRQSEPKLMEGVIEAQTLQFIVGSLKMALAKISYEAHVKQRFELPFLDLALDLAQKKPWAKEPSIAIHYHLYKCLSDYADTKSFYTIKSLFQAHLNVLPPPERSEVLSGAINYCIKRLNIGDKIFMQEAFELYKLGLSSNSLMQEGYLSRNSYNNIMLIALRLKEYEWAEAFSEQYKALLPEADRALAYAYNIAFFHYAQGNYAQAQDFLQQITAIPDPLYNLDARRMLVRIFYETNEKQALESQLESYKTYLRRHKEIGYHRTHHQNFITMVNKMIHADLDDVGRRAQLQQEVQEHGAIADKAWLLEKLF